MTITIAMTNMVPEKQNLGVSTGGNRKRNVNDNIQQATDRVLKQVENQSAFFDQVEPYTLPQFERSGTYK